MAPRVVSHVAVPSRLCIAALVVGPVGCLPEPPRPSARFDAGPPISFDVPAEDVAAVDRPALDRPSTVDGSSDAGDAGADRPTFTGDGPDPSRRYPSPPYGTQVGGVVLPFELADCVGSTFRFSGEDWVPARATVLEITAGYCAGCTELARSIQNTIVLPYRPRGVRVVGVLIDGSSPGDPPTPGFCQQWIFQAGISHPMAIDQVNALRGFTAGLPLPQWLLTDDNGRIRWRGTGSAAALMELRTRLDALLAGEP